MRCRYVQRDRVTVNYARLRPIGRRRTGMNYGIEGRAALVCGASRGIGRACAKALSREGVKTVLLARDEEKLKGCVDEIKREGGEARYLAADLSRTELLRDVAREASHLYGNIDILINNTGGPPSGGDLSFNRQVWEEGFRSTFLSAVELTKYLITAMAQRGWGRVVNLTSVSVKQPVKGLILSNSLRLAVIGWAKTLSQQFAVQGITINNIATGLTSTRRVKELARQRAQDEKREYKDVIGEMIGDVPMGRMASPTEVANLAVFLASECSSYITGTTIPVDGGLIRGSL
jgi:3-oxoacyl-[acyl-carrier protein] reductase